MKSARHVALGGLLAAVGWLMLLFALILPTGRLFLLTLASFLVVVAWAELSPPFAAAYWLTVSGLGLIYPGVFPTLFFLLFFGPAPLVSLWLARRLSGPMLWLARHLILTALMLAGVLAVGLPSLIAKPEALGWPVVWFLLIVLFQAFLVAYEFLLRAFARFWVERIRPGTSLR